MEKKWQSRQRRKRHSEDGEENSSENGEKKAVKTEKKAVVKTEKKDTEKKEKKEKVEKKKESGGDDDELALEFDFKPGMQVEILQGKRKGKKGHLVSLAKNKWTVFFDGGKKGKITTESHATHGQGLDS